MRWSGAGRDGRNGSARFDLDGFKTDLPRWRRNWDAVEVERERAQAADALFCSQYLHCAADLLYRWRTGELECEIPVIVSNHRDVERLAGYYGIPFEHVPVTAATRAEAEARQVELLARHDVELVVLARYMQILSPEFVERYPAAIINVHHSFLPAFTGARRTTRPMRAE